VQCRFKKEKEEGLNKILGAKKELSYIARMVTAPEKNGYVPVKVILAFHFTTFYVVFVDRFSSSRPSMAR